MSHLRWTCIAVLCALVILGAGCRSKESIDKPAPKTNEGPVLAPPQQQNAPAPAQGAETRPTTEGAAAAKPNSNEAAKMIVGETAEAARTRANLATPSSADRALAEKQKPWPVSNEPAKYLSKVGVQPAT